MNNSYLENKNDLFFTKLMKQAPIYTIMMLHERIKNASLLDDKYFVIREIINKQFNTNFSLLFIKQQIDFFSSSELFRGYLMYSTDVDQLITDYQKFTNYSIVFNKIEPMSKKCIVCPDNDDMLPIYEASKTFIFTENVLEQCIVLYSHCKICKWSYYPNSYSHDIARKQYIRREQFLNVDAFYFGGECVYSHRIFLSFTTALLTMRASFHGFVKYFNSIFTNKTAFSGKKLDEKNFQINWIVYSVLKLLLQWSDEEVIEIPYSLYDRDQTNVFFYQHKSKLYSEFVRYWSNQALHKTSNCTTRCIDILIVDGHQKTARTTCKFNNCYDNTVEELGPVLVGCPKSVSKCSSAYQSIIAFLNTACFQMYLEVNSNALCEKHIKIVANRGIHSMEFDASDDVTEETCNVKRNELSDNQSRSTTYGFLVSFYPCGIIAGFDESIRSESPRRVLRHLIRIGKSYIFLPHISFSFIGDISKLPSGIIYDTACSIKLYITARYGTDYFKSTPISDHFYHNVHFVLDTFHQRNHTRHMCKNEMRADHPLHKNMFDNINSQIAEQTFSIISQYKTHWSNYSYPKSYINFILFFHIYNCGVSEAPF